MKIIRWLSLLLLLGRLFGQNSNAGISIPEANGSGGTTQFELAIVSSGVATVATTGSTTVVPYIVTSPTIATATGTSWLAITGKIPCFMDANLSSGGTIYVVASIATAGYCHPQTAAPINGVGLVGYLFDSSTTASSTALVRVDPQLFGGGGSSSNLVSSVFGRTGAITATSGDYSVGQVTGAAPAANPTFTGTIAGVTETLSSTLGVTGLATLTGGGTIGSGSTFTIPSGATLTCAAGSTCPTTGTSANLALQGPSIDPFCYVDGVVHTTLAACATYLNTTLGLHGGVIYSNFPEDITVNPFPTGFAAEVWLGPGLNQ